MSVKLINNKKQVLAQFERNKKKALTAIGLKAVEVTIDYMGDTGRYGPGSKDSGIHLSGDLKRDVSFRLRKDNCAVEVGNNLKEGENLEYALWVHNGTQKMPARPYLKDAILENTDIWKEEATKHLGDKF